MEPIHLMNLTRKFENHVRTKNDSTLVDYFTERPQGEEQPVPRGNANDGGNNRGQGGNQQNKNQGHAPKGSREAATNDVPKATVYMVND